MFEVGEKVVVVLDDFGTKVSGQIVSYHYDEGDIWTVKTPRLNMVDSWGLPTRGWEYIDCAENEQGILTAL